MEWIEKMNEMFLKNRYTDDGRVFVMPVVVDNEIVEVVVKVCSKSKVINVRDLTDYGIMILIMNEVNRMYNNE